MQQLAITAARQLAPYAVSYVVDTAKDYLNTPHYATGQTDQVFNTSTNQVYNTANDQYANEELERQQRVAYDMQQAQNQQVFTANMGNAASNANVSRDIAVNAANTMNNIYQNAGNRLNTAVDNTMTAINNAGAVAAGFFGDSGKRYPWQ